MFTEAITVAIVTSVIGGTFYIAQPIVSYAVIDFLKK
jgi:hypothetical protein